MNRTWSIKDVMFLQENQTMDNRKAAMSLNRSEAAIYQKRRNLGLKFNFDDPLPYQQPSYDTNPDVFKIPEEEQLSFVPSGYSVNTTTENKQKITINDITVTIDKENNEVSIKY
tara:strand:+ start:306 stop:647 length:342 start_codon:yes stop_codon:yes gene_type:complete